MNFLLQLSGAIVILAVVIVVMASFKEDIT